MVTTVERRQLNNGSGPIKLFGMVVLRRCACICSIIVTFAAGVACKSQSAVVPRPILSCSDDGDVMEGKSATYSGFYVGGFETSIFFISNSCAVWLSDDMCMISDDVDCFSHIKAYITVEGVMSPRGQFGHLGGFDRELHVTKVVKVQRIKE